MDGAWRASGGNERLEGAPRAAGTPRGDHWPRAELDARQAPRDLLRRGLHARRIGSRRRGAPARARSRARSSPSAARCPCGRPSVLVQAPYDAEAGAPFPTLYWLSCPALVQAIGRLEASGGIELLADELARDPELAADLTPRSSGGCVATRRRPRRSRPPARRRRGPRRRDRRRGSRRRASSACTRTPRSRSPTRRTGSGARRSRSPMRATPIRAVSRERRRGARIDAARLGRRRAPAGRRAQRATRRGPRSTTASSPSCGATCAAGSGRRSRCTTSRRCTQRSASVDARRRAADRTGCRLRPRPRR